MIEELFPKHIARITKEAQEMLAEQKCNAVLFHAGMLSFYHADDQEVPFRTNAHFARFTPVSGPGHGILITENSDQPLLIELRPDDFWEEQTDSSNPFWRNTISTTEVKNNDGFWDEVVKHTKLESLVFIGDDAGVQEAKAYGVTATNPKNLIQPLDNSRAKKTLYEVACIDEANKIGAVGHKKAIQVFQDGGSEFEIHQAFLSEIQATEMDLPYESIVALNEKGATLHYRRKRRDIRNGSVLLIDAGAKVYGYASDITRTTTTANAHPVFKEILNDLETLQQKLCAEVKPGKPFIELHHEAHIGIGTILTTHKVINTTPEEAVKNGLTQAFFPHGLGHMLGLQVHDVGNSSEEGKAHELKKAHPHIRTNKKLQTGDVTTIEPGIYFNELLLSKYRTDEHANSLNWKLIDELMPCGGIRIEDNVAVTENGSENLTRKHF